VSPGLPVGPLFARSPSPPVTHSVTLRLTLAQSKVQIADVSDFTE